MARLQNYLRKQKNGSENNDDSTVNKDNEMDSEAKDLQKQDPSLSFNEAQKQVQEQPLSPWEQAQQTAYSPEAQAAVDRSMGMAMGTMGPAEGGENLLQAIKNAAAKRELGMAARGLNPNAENLGLGRGMYQKETQRALQQQPGMTIPQLRDYLIKNRGR